MNQTAISPPAERDTPPALQSPTTDGEGSSSAENRVAREETLIEHPNRGRIIPEIREIGIADYRELIEGPYRICFRVYGREVVIVAVLDARRDLSRLLIDRAMGR